MSVFMRRREREKEREREREGGKRGKKEIEDEIGYTAARAY